MEISREVYDWYHNRVQYLDISSIKPTDLFLLFEKKIMKTGTDSVGWPEGETYMTSRIDGNFLINDVLPFYKDDLHVWFVMRRV